MYIPHHVRLTIFNAPHHTLCTQMQIMPPSVQTNTRDQTPDAKGVSRRRLILLVATATVASGLGVVLGSTLRFQVLPVSEAPLFKPQQDFPPLAEWPPRVPMAKERTDFDANWEREAPIRSLTYNNTEEPEAVSDDGFYGEDYAPESPVVPDPVPSDLGSGDTAPDTTMEVFVDESLPPMVSTSTRNIENDSDDADETQASNVDSALDSLPLFDKQPVSESHLENTPLIITPDDPSLYPHSLPE